MYIRLHWKSLNQNSSFGVSFANQTWFQFLVDSCGLWTSAKYFHWNAGTIQLNNVSKPGHVLVSGWVLVQSECSFQDRPVWTNRSLGIGDGWSLYTWVIFINYISIGWSLKLPDWKLWQWWELWNVKKKTGSQWRIDEAELLDPEKTEIFAEDTATISLM